MQHISKIIRKQPGQPNDPASDIDKLVRSFAGKYLVSFSVNEKQLVVYINGSAAAGFLRGNIRSLSGDKKISPRKVILRVVT